MAPRSQEPQEEWVPLNEGLAKLSKLKEEKTNDLVDKIANTIEAQNFFTQLEEAPKFEDLPKETQKEILGNPEDWDRIPNLEKPIRTRKKKTKSKPEVKEKPPKIKYFVEFKINVKGDRKEVGYIIETEDEKLITKLTTTRALNEYVNFRTLNCLSYRVWQEGDEEYSKDITETPRTSSEVLSEESNIDNKEEDIRIKLLKNMPNYIKNTKFWKIAVTPGRRPRQRDFEKYSVVEMANSAEEAKERVRKNLGLAGNELKDKNMAVIPISVEDLVMSDRFKTFLDKFDKNELDGLSLSDILDLPDEPKEKPNSEKERLTPTDEDTLSKYSAEIDKNGFITKVYPVIDNVLEQSVAQDYIKFYITPIRTSIMYRTTEVMAKDEYMATSSFINAVLGYLRDERRTTNLYKEVNRVSVVNSKTGSISDLSIALEEVKKK